MQLPNGSVWPCRRTKKEKQDGSYQTLKLAMETTKKEKQTGEDGSYHTAEPFF